MTPGNLTPGIRRRQAAAQLRAPWQWRRNDGLLWALGLYGLVLLPLLVLPSLAALVWLPWPGAWAAVAVLAGLGLVLLWGQQVSALLRLDHPHTARLVPGHADALRRTALGLWLGLALALCLVGTALLVLWRVRIGQATHRVLPAAEALP